MVTRLGKAKVAAPRKLGIELYIMLRDRIDYKELCCRRELQKSVVTVQSGPASHRVLQGSDRHTNWATHLLESRGARRTDHGRQRRKRCWVGDSEMAN